MYKLDISMSGLLYAAELEEGSDLVAGYTERDLNVETEPIEGAICTFMKKLRLDKGLDISKLSIKTDVSEDILNNIEHKGGYKPDPRTLLKLSSFYKIPMRAFVEMVGAKQSSSNTVKYGVVEFAMESESLEKLSKEEETLLKQFVEVLRNEYGD